MAGKSITHPLFCGSWLACDASSSVHQADPVDAIAGKPAPTFLPRSTVRDRSALRPLCLAGKSITHPLFCGSWLACDAGSLVHQADPVDAIAGKPAPTFLPRSTVRDRSAFRPLCLAGKSITHPLFCGSWLACDASSSVHQAEPVDAIAGKPAPTFLPRSTVRDRSAFRPLCLAGKSITHPLFCGSWLACDAGSSVHQADPVDAIAGKPAPTFPPLPQQWICTPPTSPPPPQAATTASAADNHPSPAAPAHCW
ncbi:hypothetical protein ACVWXR_004388 [Pseudomonas lurida]